MGVYTLREISRRNYDSDWGAKPQGHNHNSWGIFLVVRTCPYINEFITWGNHKMNADWDADGLFSSALPLTCSDSALSKSPCRRWESHEINANRPHISTALSPTCSNSVLSRSLAVIFTHVQTCYECNWPCYKRDHPWYEHHAPVTSVTPLLRAWPLMCHMVTQNSTCAVPFILWLPSNKYWYISSYINYTNNKLLTVSIKRLGPKSPEGSKHPGFYSKNTVHVYYSYILTVHAVLKQNNVLCSASMSNSLLHLKESRTSMHCLNTGSLLNIL